MAYEKGEVYYEVWGAMKKVLDHWEQNWEKNTGGSILMTAGRSLIKVGLE